MALHGGGGTTLTIVRSTVLFVVASRLCKDRFLSHILSALASMGVLLLILDEWNIPWLCIGSPIKCSVKVRWVDRNTGKLSSPYVFDHSEYDMHRVLYTHVIPVCSVDEEYVEPPKVYLMPPADDRFSGFVRSCAHLIQTHFFNRRLGSVHCLITINLRKQGCTKRGNFLGVASARVPDGSSFERVCGMLRAAIESRRSDVRHEKLSSWLTWPTADVVFNNVRNGENFKGEASHMRVLHNRNVRIPRYPRYRMFILSHDGEGWYIARMVAYAWLQPVGCAATLFLAAMCAHVRMRIQSGSSDLG